MTRLTGLALAVFALGHLRDIFEILEPIVEIFS